MGTFDSTSKTVGGGAATPVANNWEQFLNSGLTGNGQFGTGGSLSAAQQQVQAAYNSNLAAIKSSSLSDKDKQAMIASITNGAISKGYNPNSQTQGQVTGTLSGSTPHGMLGDWTPINQGNTAASGNVGGGQVNVNQGQAGVINGMQNGNPQQLGSGVQPYTGGQVNTQAQPQLNGGNAGQNNNGLAGAINNMLSGNVQGVQNIGVDQSNTNGIAQQLAAGYGAGPQYSNGSIGDVNSTASQLQNGGPGQSTAYNNALSQLGSQISQQSNNPLGGLTAPNASAPGAFSSQGLLGDRSNVTNALTNAANTQLGSSLANIREHLSQAGGLSGGTSSAYAQSQGAAQGSADLANTLAQNDLAYRNQDLNAYNDQGQLANQAAGVNAGIYGSQLGALGQNNSNIGSMLNNLLGQQYNEQQLQSSNINNAGQLQTQAGQLQGNLNTQNLNSALGFNQLNQTGLNQAGQTYQAQNTLNSQNQQNNAANNINLQQLAQNGQLGIIQQLMQAYGQSAGIGIPAANTQVTPGVGTQIASTIGGIARGAGALATGLK